MRHVVAAARKVVDEEIRIILGVFDDEDAERGAHHGGSYGYIGG
jgi:hypothetical protein